VVAKKVSEGENSWAKRRRNCKGFGLRSATAIYTTIKYFGVEKIVLIKYDLGVVFEKAKEYNKIHSMKHIAKFYQFLGRYKGRMVIFLVVLALGVVLKQSDLIG
jgi:hypothetical protein